MTNIHISNGRKLVSGFVVACLAFLGLFFCKSNVYADIKEDLSAIRIDAGEIIVEKTQEADYAPLVEILKKYDSEKLKLSTLEKVDGLVNNDAELGKSLRKDLFDANDGAKNKISYTIKKGGQIIGRAAVILLGPVLDNYVVTVHAFMNPELFAADKTKVAEALTTLMKNVVKKAGIAGCFAGCYFPGDALLNELYGKLYAFSVSGELKDWYFKECKLTKDEIKELTKGFYDFKDGEFKFFVSCVPLAKAFIGGVLDKLDDENFRKAMLEEIKKNYGEELVNGFPKFFEELNSKTFGQQQEEVK